MTCLSVSGASHAGPKPCYWGWWPNHWWNQDFQPYIDPAKEPHNGQWDNSNWRPQDWIAQRKDEMALIRGFYFADILRDQYQDDGIPVLEVGPAFYMLGGEDKRRVTKTIDTVFNITQAQENGMFMLYDWYTEKPIGSYTRYGLQLQ